VSDTQQHGADMAAMEMPPRASAEFVESSVLEAVIPSDTDIDIEDELSSWDGSNTDEAGSIVPFLTQRQVLLFGTWIIPQ
jgi:hypothetical protein